MEKFIEKFREIINLRIENFGTMDVALSLYNGIKNIDRVKCVLIESVGFIDSYKKLNYKKATSTFTKKDLFMLPKIDSIANPENINKYIKNDSTFLIYMIDSIYDFHNATILEKVSQIKALKEEDKQFLIEFFPSFQEDLDDYDIKVNVELFYKYYKDLEKFYISKSLPIKRSVIIDQIVGFIKNLYCYDNENFIFIILKLAAIDYKYSYAFIKNGRYPNISNGIKKAIYRGNIFEEKEVNDILEYAILDDYYLYELVDIYLYTRDNHLKKEDYDFEYQTLEVPKVKEKIKKIEKSVRCYEN